MDPSQSLEEMAQELPLMLSIGKKFLGGLSCYPLAGGTDGFADWHSFGIWKIASVSRIDVSAIPAIG